jgi:hypothetical protein
MLEDGFYFVYSDNSYHKFAAKFVRHTKYPQNKIKADELQFKADKKTIMPPYVEVIYVVDGQHVFHGIVTDRGDGLDGWSCKAKSMQWLLDYRYFPGYIYHGLSLNAILSSSVPSTYMGALFLMQSIIPNGKWIASTTKIIKLVGGGSKSAIGSAALYASTNYPNLTADACDGVKTLSAASSASAVSTNQYYRDADDLYVQLGDGSYRPNAYLVAAAFWCDCKIRLGTIDIGTKIPTTDISLEGKGKDSLDDLIEKIGREAAFRPENDGHVRLYLDDEISRGSESEPLRTFIHGRNSIIKITPKTEPDVQVAIGLDGDNASTAVSDWRNIEPQIFSVYDGQGELREELTEHLQAILDKNADSYSAELPYEDHFLRIGDYVELQKDSQTYSLRIAKIDIQPGKTTLDCGKKIFDASEKFGELLRYEVDTAAEPIQTKTITNGSGSFVVEYANIVAGGWKCYYEESFDSASTDTSLSKNPFCVIKVAGRIVPPGRIKIDSGSIKIDITDYCSKSTTKNVTNDVVRTMYNYTGWSSSKSEIKQYRGRRFL